MAALHKVLLILPLLFLAAIDAKKEKDKRRKHDEFGDDLTIFKNIPHFPISDGNPAHNNDNLNAPQDNLVDAGAVGNNIENGNIGPIQDQPPKPDFETNFNGAWELANDNAGVSAMHVQLLPNNRIYVYDATVYHISRLRARPGECITYVENQKPPRQDCWAHVVEYDVETNQVVRPIKIETDPWCSSGGVAPDGTLVSTGGFLSGTRSVRFLSDCPDCQWRDFPAALQEDRWYATQAKLPNGGFIVVGGRRSFSYEFVPMEGGASAKPYLFPFLYETSDLEENNLYPFVHLSIDGNLFIFSNNRSLLFDPRTLKVVRTFPVLPGGSRNYPASGMSALIPIKLDAAGQAQAAEVMICGGNTPDAFHLAETLKIFLPALQDCARMIITAPNPVWDVEMMPSRRTMGDLLNLPNGQLLIINGAENGTSAWWDAEVPNFTPVLYSPDAPKGQRFKVLAATQIARMYHSTSAVIPNGKIWVSGSNTHNTYKNVDRYPTETRVENFSPPYLDPALAKFRPEIVEATSAKQLKYKANFETSFTVMDPAGLTKNDIKVVMYTPPFTTHGYSMNQRQLVFVPTTLTVEAGGVNKIVSVAPASGEVAPPGYYLLFVVHRGVPSRGMWVQIGV